MLNSFDDELIIAGYVEDGSASSRICQLNQGVVTKRILARQRQTNIQTVIYVDHVHTLLSLLCLKSSLTLCPWKYNREVTIINTCLS